MNPQELTVNILNDNQEKLNSSVVELMNNRLDGNVHKSASAYTTEQVTGSMYVVDWNLYKSKCRHLKELKVPQVGPKPIVDLLSGVDHADLLYSIEDIRGRPLRMAVNSIALPWNYQALSNGPALLAKHREITTEVSRTCQGLW